MIFTFYRALGYNTGKSMVEEEFIPMAKSLMDKANAKGVKFFLPEDVIIADEFKSDANSNTVFNYEHFFIFKYPLLTTCLL